MKNKNITIDIVSKEANVSKTTISRYLNGKFEHMSEETRERIKSVIDELEYRPNVIAQNLKSKKTGLIGVIVSDITNPFVSILIKGIIDVCTKEGYQVITASSNEIMEKEVEYIKSMIDRQVEGLIVNTTGNNEDFLRSLKDKGIKVVLADRPMNQCVLDTVTTDNYEMTIKSIRSLYNCGFDKVALFSNQIFESNVRVARYNAFIKASKDYVDKPNSLIYILDNNTEEEYKKSLLDFINRYPNEKVAIFTVNGVTTLNLLKASKNLNLKAPEDFGLCGYDDWDWAKLIGNGISAVSQPSYDVGVESAKILIGRIKNHILQKKPMYVELKSKLILRGSTNMKFVYKGRNVNAQK